MTTDRFGAFLSGVPDTSRRALEELRRRIATGPQVERGGFTPSTTNINVGTGGTNEAVYTYVGGTNKWDNGMLYVNGRITAGSSGFSLASPAYVGLPPGFKIPGTYYTTIVPLPGGCTWYDASNGFNYAGQVWFNSNTNVRLMRLVVTEISGAVGEIRFSGTAAATWAAGDGMRYSYQVAAQRT